jgi:NarL family two-component system response regulator YdfI
VTSVFIIAASDIVRTGLESLLSAEVGFTIAGSAVDLPDFATHGAEGVSPDVVIFDVERHGDASAEALRHLIESGHDDHDVPALVVIGAEKEEWLLETLRAGLVRATLPHEASSDEIIAAVAAVSNGLFAMDAETFALVLSSSTSIADTSADTQADEERILSVEPLLDALTSREREVLELLAEGLSNKEIAWRMKISEHTVKFHVASIFAKLGVSTRTEAVIHGIRQGLILI